MSMNAVDVRFAHSPATAITHQQSIWLVNHAAEHSGVQTEQSVGHALMVNPELRLFEHDATRTAHKLCLLYTSPSPRDGATSRMPSSA